MKRFSSRTEISKFQVDPPGGDRKEIVVKMAVVMRSITSHLTRRRSMLSFLSRRRQMTYAGKAKIDIYIQYNTGRW